MIKTIAITLANPEPMMVTWDIGRRCNYDCTYCESSRHDLISPLHSLDKLKQTFTFIKEWTSVYNSKRQFSAFTNLNFTGGEPTVNPEFWNLARYIKETEPRFNLSLTTNGAWSYKNIETIIELFNGVTVSYHAEAHITLKKNVLKNIKLLHKAGIWLQVNVMMHTDYFDECITVCNELTQLGIKHNPRPIGDGNIERKGWFIDQDGSNRRTSHSYSEDQQTWYFNYIGVSKSSNGSKEGTQLGRSCCGQRCTLGKQGDSWSEVKTVDTQFKDWHCMVDWYFLHIDQHTELIYHHQTCQALHMKKKGALGQLSDRNQLILDLKNRLNSDTVESIICPNSRCGCGMCVPKAKSFSDFTAMASSVTTVILN
jgi:MoaA/NifB/PqqE/SkfB family radical SAM enzyme